ncbi:hypothetical protein KFL_002210080 [Klebsormidium nitens]|uniref:RING-type E3 ubiquitin transferase n=1 Tax=Klebsormidium nitens TaxID=105231 RepID=A0A1Y1I3S4_KLENI|nr:hypothetical protein KFL_002210080 [Klebsormidium nitens]|eukprot:GAQ85143.1 hypothetical protein KFL_002210080 [Klebsormidium nitens]
MENKVQTTSEEDIRRWVDLLGSSSEAVQGKAVLAIKSIADEATSRKTIGAIPEALGRPSDEVQALAAWALCYIAYDSANKKAIAAVPGSLGRLVDLLGSSSDEVQAQAAGALRNLACDSANKKDIAAISGALGRLVDLLGSSRQDAQACAAAALGNLAGDPANQEVIAAVPGAVSRLVDLLESSSEEVRGAAALALKRLERSPAAEMVIDAAKPYCSTAMTPLGDPGLVTEQQASRTSAKASQAADVARATLILEQAKVEALQAAIRAERAKVKELQWKLEAAPTVGGKCSSDGQNTTNGLNRYTFKELSQATGGWAPENVLGEGGFGKVYKGVLDHTEVAIKVMTGEGLQGRDQFEREVQVHCRVRHPNIAMLLGTCLEPQICLAYDLMPNGNLEERLLRTGGSPALTWQTRVRIAAEVAVALLYLHSARPAPIIHRDIKPANILLDQNLVSKLGDLLTARAPLGLRKAVSQALGSDRLETVLDASAGVWPPAVAAALARLGLQCTETSRAARPSLRTEVVPTLVGLRSQTLSPTAEATGQSAGDEVPHRFICPISQDVMEEPVLAADGNHYDRSFIAKWLETHTTSPLTNLDFEHRNLVLDRALLNEIREWKQLHAESV